MMIKGKPSGSGKRSLGGRLLAATFTCAVRSDNGRGYAIATCIRGIRLAQNNIHNRVIR